MRNALGTAILAIGLVGPTTALNNTPTPNNNCPGASAPEAYRIKPGVGVYIQPGSMAGYAITANVGGSYRVVWTGTPASR